MDPLLLLKQLDLVQENKTVLDVGTKNGMTASQFAELGLEVDAIDIKQPDKFIENVNFKEISVEDFLLHN
ncbi:MAG: hypothetical protein LR008_03785 [Candidatus Pacebacteria bacterium]|nr:hypothetical protein [Candidatus Paceibacterota bacterium]